MRCYICDEIIKDDKVRVNFITKKIEPCIKCMESVHSVVDSYQPQEVEVFDDDEDYDPFLGPEEPEGRSEFWDQE